jgi:hypothetical protein
MNSVPYTKAEKQEIQDLYEMNLVHDEIVALVYEEIASFINKKYHAGKEVRTVQLIETQVSKLKR